MLSLLFTSTLNKVLAIETLILTLEAPTPQNGPTHSNNLLAVAILFDHLVRLTLQGLILSGYLRKHKKEAKRLMSG